MPRTRVVAREALGPAGEAKMPHYLLLADHRDLSEELESMGANSTANLTFYAPEVALEPGATPLVSPLMPRYFHFLDSSQDMYVPRPDLARLYPDDVGSHYRDHASKEELPETDAKGQPLLRVVQDGRLIAHGRPVPVLRKGMFLVATEGIQDQMFGQSVILLLNHSDYEGTLGVIVNKPIEEAVKKQTLRHAQSNLDAWRSMGRDYGRAEALLALLRVPGVDLRMGGPVGMMEFPLGTAHVVLHPFPDVRAPSSPWRAPAPAPTRYDVPTYLRLDHQQELPAPRKYRNGRTSSRASSGASAKPASPTSRGAPGGWRAPAGPAARAASSCSRAPAGGAPGL
ncbi:unnamed protein product [Prorocentrum cordatum]|uniref:Uncharacterized protein n=1 Tax=Prorocentrum cordatum TaxID=2364126 RepID=A0ABN9UPC0_9DINO|nr:unnamed protein product [Polarella glacialis]